MVPDVCRCYGLDAQTFRLSQKASRSNPLLPLDACSAKKPPGLMVREEIWESGFAWMVPCEYLTYRLAQWKIIQRNYKMQNVEIFAADPPNLSRREKNEREHLRAIYAKVEGAAKVRANSSRSCTARCTR